MGETIATTEELRGQVGEPIPAVQLKIWNKLEPSAVEFIRLSPFFVLATADAQGNLDVSPKGDGPGGVHVEDETTLLVPDRLGNRLVFGLQNVLENPHVGLLFMVPGTPETLRVNGRAELVRDPAVLERLAARGKPAVVAIRIRVDECFFHCAKAFLRAELWKPETWPDRQKISFGRMLFRENADVASQVDQAVEKDYRENL